MQPSSLASSQNASPAPASTLEAALNTLRDESGRTLQQVCNERPTLVCLLRHNGCTFCREAIAELAKQKEQIERAGLGIAVVGMSASVASLKALGQRFGLSGVHWMVDPSRLLYQALNIRRGNFLQLLGPRVLMSGLRAALRGYGIGRPEGDVFQMPGTVIIHQGRVLRRYLHQTAADRPDYTSFACDLP